MKYIVTADIGTTAVKGVLVSEKGDAVSTQIINIDTVFQGDFKEQRPDDWYRAFCKIGKTFLQNDCSPADISGIIMSGQMQDLIPVDREGNAVCRAILYSDGRAQKQAVRIVETIGETAIAEKTGNHFDGSMPFPKLLWLMENQPENYHKIDRILISAKDYIIRKLTDRCVTDVTSGATTGLMDIHKKRWCSNWLLKFRMDEKMWPALQYAEDISGTVTAKAASETGLLQGTPVYAGTGDAGATTLASGICADGEFNVNLGTSGWVACVASDVLLQDGVFNLAAMPKGLYINVVPFLNAGNVHKWICRTLAKDTEQKEKYDYVDELLKTSVAGSHGLLCLPYLTGERFPVMDSEIRGAYYGITPETDKRDLARACLEGVAFSIRQGLESIGREIRKISLIGGGAQDKVWCQVFADVLGHEITVYQNAKYLPSMAVASASLLAQGKISNYTEFTDSMKQPQNCIRYFPDPTAVKTMEKNYRIYRRLYPALKDL